MADYDASVRIDTKVNNADLQKIHDDLVEMEKKFGNLSDVIEDYETRLKRLRAKGFGPGDKEFNELYIAWKNSVNAEKEYIANLEKMTDKGMAEEAARVAKEQEKHAKIQATIAEQERLQAIKDSAVVSDEHMVELLQRQAKLKAYLNDLEKAGITAGYEQFDNTTMELQRINSEIAARKKLSHSLEEEARGFQKLKESCKRFLQVIQNGTKKSNGLLATMNSRLKGIALSLLVFNWITKGFNAMVAAMKEGFQNLAQYSSEYNASMSALKSSTEQLKNSLAAAFEPLVNMAIPYLTRLVNWANKAADSVAQFIAVLQGKNTYTRAKEQVLDYASSLENASKSAKRALASFDELNVVNKDGNADNGALTGADAFEEATIDPETYVMLEKAKELLETILPLAAGVAVFVAAWKIAGFLSDLGSVVMNLKNAYAVIMIIAGLVLMVSKYFNMWNDSVDWEGIIGYIAGVALAVGGLLMAFGSLGAGIGLIVSGIAGLVLAFKDMCENGFTAENMCLALLSVVGLLVGVFLVFGGAVTGVVAIVLAVIGAIAGMVIAAGNGQEALDTLRRMFSKLGDFVKNVFAGNWEDAIADIREATYELANFCNIIIESVVNCIIKGLNWLIDKINSISFDVPDWVPGIGGDTLSPNIGKLQEISLPRLANGTVIPGGRPFAAILGDQPAGQTNIEAPLSTIEQALQNVVDKNGGTGDINLTINLDGDPVYKSIVKRDRIYQKTTGHSAFAF